MELFTFLDLINAEEEVLVSSRNLISNYRKAPFHAHIKNAWLIKGQFKMSMSQSGDTVDEALLNLAQYIAGEKILYRDYEYRVPTNLTHTLKYFGDDNDRSTTVREG